MDLSCAATLTCEIAPRAFIPRSAASVDWPVQVLLVEDSIEAAELVRIYLTEDEADPFRVEWTPNLLDAMSRLARPGIEVVLLDLGLHELSGYKTYRAIEASAAYKTPVVIFTADDSTVSRDLTLGFGAADYLLKGESSPADLRNALRRAVIGGARSPR